MLLLLLRHQVRLWWFGHTRSARAGLRLVPVIVVVLAFVLLPLAVGASYVYVRGLNARDPAVAPGYLAAVFLGLSLLLLLSGVGGIVHRLYLASDLDLLLSAPVPLPMLFAAKIVGVSTGVGVAVTTCFAGIIGYGLARGAPVAFYPLAAVLTLAVTGLAAACAMALVMLTVRIVPPGRVQTAATLLATLLGAGVWLLLQSNQLARVNDAGGGVDGTLGRLQSLTGWLPATWAGRALVALEGSQWGALTGYLALTSAACIAAYGGAYMVFRATFYMGHNRLPGGAAPAERMATAADRHVWQLPGIPFDAWAIAVKDWRTMSRDIRSLSGLLFPLVTGTFYAYQLIRRSDLSEAALWLPLAGVPLVLLVGGATLPLLALGREGRDYAVLRMSPVTPGRILMGKAIGSGAPLLLLAWLTVLVLGVWDRASVGQTVALLLMCAWYTVGATLAYMSAGALGARFDADNPQWSIGCLGQIYANAAGALFLGSSAALAAWLALLVRGEYPADGAFAVLVAALLAAGAGAGVLVVMWLVRSAIARLAAWEVP